MRRVIGMDIHRTFAEVVFWEAGKLRSAGRVSMTRAALERFGDSLRKEDEVVIEATGNAMAVVRVLSPSREVCLQLVEAGCFVLDYSSRAPAWA